MLSPGDLVPLVIFRRRGRRRSRTRAHTMAATSRDATTSRELELEDSATVYHQIVCDRSPAIWLRWPLTCEVVAWRWLTTVSALLVSGAIVLFAAVLFVGSELQPPPSHTLAALPAQPADLVSTLPGLGHPPVEVQYAGHVGVADNCNQLFYWFVQSSRVDAGEAAAAVPLVIWLNGGPGASSLTGLLIEGIGPYTLQADGRTLVANPWSWHRLAHVLVWDQPVGAGFAFTERADGYVRSMPQMATQLLAGLNGFYSRHPEYRACPVYVTGESFAGKYIPAFVEHVHHSNSDRSAEQRINLVGAAIGNGVFKPLDQYRAIPEVARALGYANDQASEWAAKQLDRCAALLHAPSVDWAAAYASCRNAPPG